MKRAVPAQIQWSKLLPVLRLLVGLLILAGAVWLAKGWMDSPPETKRSAPPPQVKVVEVAPLIPGAETITLRSQGTVQAITETAIIPEVSGRVTAISPSLREGGTFNDGEVLVKIEDVDYRTALIVASGAVFQAYSTYENERARAQLAEREWRRSGNVKAPTDFYLRKPQIAAAEAEVATAAARLEQAERDFQRTTIRAPYAGRVTTKNVDVGQVVTPGSRLAEIFATDAAEVRLPLTSEQLSQIALPSSTDGSPVPGPRVTIRSTFGGNAATWPARIVRTDSAVDVRTRQLFAVAQIDDPTGRKNGGPALKMGQFVQAEIEGKLLFNVLTIPRNLVREDRYVLIVDSEGKLQRRDIEILWREPELVLARTDLNPGDQLCLTSVPYAVNGMPVVTPEQAAAAAKKRGGPGGSGGRQRGGAGAPGQGSGASAGPGERPAGAEGRPDGAARPEGRPGRKGDGTGRPGGKKGPRATAE